MEAAGRVLAHPVAEVAQVRRRAVGRSAAAGHGPSSTSTRRRNVAWSAPRATSIVTFHGAARERLVGHIGRAADMGEAQGDVLGLVDRALRRRRQRLAG